MGKIYEARQAKIEKGIFGPTVSGAFKKKYPCLADALQGIKDPDGKVVLPRFQLQLNAGEDGVRFTLKSFEPSETWYGPTSGTEDLLAHVDACIGRWELQQVREKESQNGEKRGR